jgi:hypothetical protein
VIASQAAMPSRVEPPVSSRHRRRPTAAPACSARATASPSSSASMSGGSDAPWTGGPYYAVNVNCLEDVDPAGLIVRHFDGRHDDWSNPRIERLGAPA